MQVCELTVVAELVSPALPSVPVNPSCTPPADGFENVAVRPLKAALFRKFTVVAEVNGVPFTSNAVAAPEPQLGTPLASSVNCPVLPLFPANHFH